MGNSASDKFLKLIFFVDVYLSRKAVHKKTVNVSFAGVGGRVGKKRYNVVTVPSLPWNCGLLTRLSWYKESTMRVHTVHTSSVEK